MRIALAAILALTGAAAASGPAAPDLRDLLWTDPSADPAVVLTHPPRECLRNPLNADVEAGRALFRSRALLGGPASRVGLSCESCHTSGRTNAHFLLPELTDRAGAADVTSEWASKVRGDRIMNPKPIPDLAGVGSRANFGSKKDPSLHHFVQSVIVEEFQGLQPPDSARAALISYLKALDANCPSASAPLSIQALTNDVRRAAAAAQAKAKEGDEPTADLTLLAAQDAIARLVERLPAQDFAAGREKLEALSRDLGQARYAKPLKASLPKTMPGWSARFDAAAHPMEKQTSRTYANEKTLRAALAAAKP